MKNKKLQSSIYCALFGAIEVVLVMVPFLGYIPIGPMRATTLHIPVLIAGIVLGRKSGALVGFIFGFMSLLYNTINPTVTSFVFSPFISGNIMSAVIAILPRMAIGYIAGLLYEKMHNKWSNDTLCMSLSAFCGAACNTVLVLGGIYVLFGQTYANAIGQSYDTLVTYLLAIVTGQGVLEALVGMVIATSVSKILCKTVRR